jgi:hypothetical protein
MQEYSSCQCLEKNKCQGIGASNFNSWVQVCLADSKVTFHNNLEIHNKLKTMWIGNAHQVIIFTISIHGWIISKWHQKIRKKKTLVKCPEVKPYRSRIRFSSFFLSTPTIQWKSVKLKHIVATLPDRVLADSPHCRALAERRARTWCMRDYHKWNMSIVILIHPHSFRDDRGYTDKNMLCHLHLYHRV